MVILMKSIFKKSKILNKIVFYLGKVFFQLFGKTPKIAYMAMVNLYCLTNGKFLAKLNQRNNFSSTINEQSKFFKEATSGNINQVAKEIRDDGYKIFQHQLNPEAIAELKSFSYSLKAKVGENQILFDPKNKKSNIYKFNPNDVIQNKWVQDLIMDPVLINIAGTYLGANPIFDFAAMWWSTDFKTQMEDAAQEYHFDLDRPKWLKIFIYLTDVNKDNGPHCYISGTHKVGSKPQEILNRGYVRVADEELIKHYPKNTFKEVTGQAGMIVFGDTSCWHKGKPIVEGDRLILQLEYTSSLFGLNLPKFKVSNKTKSFSEFCHKNSYYTQNIILNT